MASDARRKTGHCRRCAAQAPCDLAMRTSGHQTCGDGQQQFGTFHVVRTGEGLQGERASAAAAAKARNASPRIDISTVRPFSGTAVSLCRAVLRALRPRAERRSETVDSPAFHRLAGNAHAAGVRARAVPLAGEPIHGDSERVRDRSDRMRTLSAGHTDRRRTTICAPPWGF